MQEQCHRTLFIDGNSLFKTSFEATYNSEDFNAKNLLAVAAFLLKVQSLLDYGNYSLLRIAFDGNHKGVLRRFVYPHYKKSRLTPKNESPYDKEKRLDFNNQKERLKTILSYFVATYEDEKVEADDIIALYVLGKDETEKITIATGDVDIMQLLQPNVEVYYLNKKFKFKSSKTDKVDQFQTITHKNFHKFFGYPSENIVLIKSICGDNSDDISNVKLVKETSLFNAFPQIQQTPCSIQNILTECASKLNDDNIGKVQQRTYNNILNGVTDGIQGKHILTTNERIVNLKNHEFITETCKKNLQSINFLKREKFQANNGNLLMLNLKSDDLFIILTEKHKTINNFFKPFYKTIITNAN